MLRSIARYFGKLFRQSQRKRSYTSYLRSAHWSRVRAYFITPDARCVACGAFNSPSNPLQLHHRAYYIHSKSVLYHELEYPSCVEVRCKNCHQKHHRRAFG